MSRQARAWMRTCLVLVLAVLAALALGRPALAGDPTADADGAPVTGEDFAQIDAEQPHVGGYMPNTTRTVAKPAGLGGGAYDQLPASVDLEQYFPSVGDQGGIGMCVAWTLTRHIMGYYAARTGAVDTPYAPLYLYMRNVSSGGAPNSGLNPDSVLANLQAYGTDSQDDYWQGTANYKVAPTSAEITNAANYKITGWKRLFSGANQGTNAQTVIKEALANGDPVAVGFPVYSDFMNLGRHALYNTLSGTSLGGHMVTAYGYDANGLYLRNQWGTSWGDAGDAHVSWAFVNQVMTGAYTINGITTPATAVSIAPQVTGLSVTKGAVGSTVTVTGSGLTKATAVSFGGTSASFTTPNVNGVTRVVATVPAHAYGTVDITVTNPAGSSVNTSADDFTYPPPAPALTGISPSSGSTVGGTTVTLTGTDLTGATAVKIGTASVTPSAVSSGSLTFTTPARAAGSVSVQVVTPGGTSGSKTFAYVTPPAPALSGLSPNSGLGAGSTLVTITGSSLDDATAVLVGGASAPFTRLSATQLRVTVPAHAAGIGSIQVTGPGGTSNSQTFTWTAYGVPTTTSLSPASGAGNVTTTVVVTGTNLTQVTKVMLGTTSLSYTMVDGTTLKVFVAPRAAGAATLKITTNGGTSAGITFTTVTPSKPVITSLSPALGLTTASTTVVVDGSGFTGATRLSLGGRAMTVTRLSDTRLRFVAPAHAAAALRVVVVAPGGTSAAKTFTYKSTLVPVLTSMSPNTGWTTGNTVSVLTGRYLTGASIVYSGTSRVSFTRVSDTQIRVTLVRRSAGSVIIKVKTAGGTSNGLTFRYVLPPAPVVTGLSATAGPADQSRTITVTGNYLNGVTRVTIGGTAVSVKQGTTTQITVTLPAKAAGAYDLVVTTSAGTSSLTPGDRYTYT